MIWCAPLSQFTPGKDGAGVVASVGPGVDKLRVGDRVYLYGKCNSLHVSFSAFLCLSLRFRSADCLVFLTPFSFADSAVAILPFTSFHPIAGANSGTMAEYCVCKAAQVRGTAHAPGAAWPSCLSSPCLPSPCLSPCR